MSLKPENPVPENPDKAASPNDGRRLRLTPKETTDLLPPEDLQALHSGLTLLLEQLKIREQFSPYTGCVDQNNNPTYESRAKSGDEAFFRYMVAQLPQSLRTQVLNANDSDRVERNKARLQVGGVAAALAAYLGILYAVSQMEYFWPKYEILIVMIVTLLGTVGMMAKDSSNEEGKILSVALKGAKEIKVPPEAELYYRAARKVYNLRQSAQVLEKGGSTKAPAMKAAAKKGTRMLAELAVQLNFSMNTPPGGDSLTDELLKAGAGENLRIATEEVERASDVLTAYENLSPEAMEAEMAAEFQAALEEAENKKRIGD